MILRGKVIKTIYDDFLIRVTEEFDNYIVGYKVLGIKPKNKIKKIVVNRSDIDIIYKG